MLFQIKNTLLEQKNKVYYAYYDELLPKVKLQLKLQVIPLQKILCLLGLE